MDNYDINVYSSDEEARRPRIFRPRIDYFEEYDDYDFFCRFRLMPRTVENLLEEIEDTIAHPTGHRNDCLTASQQLLLTLNFYATGSFLRLAGDSSGVSKATACRVVRRVSLAIAALRPIYIKMAAGEEVNNVRQKFFDISRFPRCIGAIDCSHVKIQSPGGPNAEIFRNRKQFFSFNVQSVSDTDLKFRDIVVRWHGSAHDAHIFRNSALYTNLERGQFADSLLVGDSGYPIKPYLITPLRDVRNNAQALFNESLIRTRNVVERKYGVWKRRFPALAMGLRLRKLDTIQAVIVATAVLHNIACMENEQLPPINNEQEAAINFVNVVNVPNIVEEPVLENNRTRYNLINNYFANL